MSFLVLVAPPALKDLDGLPPTIRPRIVVALRSLAADPRPSGCKKLEGTAHTWRLRVRDYRVLYTVDDADRAVRVYP